MAKTYSYLIKNGKVIDGSGNPYYKADIAIKDGKIFCIKPDINPDDAEACLDAQGLTVSPGFVDAHTHDDLYLLSKPDADEKVRQGITTVITGNCGFSAAPIQKDQTGILGSYTGLLGGEDVIDKFQGVDNFAAFLDLMEKSKPGVNMAGLVGNVTLRTTVMGHAMRKPTAEEMQKMKDLLKESLRAGAFGFSSGLVYAPGSYASTEELSELAEVLEPYQGIYTSHIRGESDQVLNSVKEAIQIGKKAGVRVQISHLKVSGKNNWGKSEKVIQLIEEAREDGLQITADQYPYNAGSTGLFALLPPDTLSEGIEKLSLNLQDKAYRNALRERLSPQHLNQSDGMLKEAGFDKIVIAACPSHPQYEGNSVAFISENQGLDPLDLIFDLVSANKLGVTMVIFNMSDTDIQNIMRKSFVMMGSDGLPTFGAKIHPDSLALR